MADNNSETVEENGGESIKDDSETHQLGGHVNETIPEPLVNSEASKLLTKDPEDDKTVGDVKFDDVLQQLGGFGPYQRLSYFLLFLPTIFSAMHKLSWVFLGAKVDHRYTWVR